MIAKYIIGIWFFQERNIISNGIINSIYFKIGTCIISDNKMVEAQLREYTCHGLYCKQ